MLKLNEQAIAQLPPEEQAKARQLLEQYKRLRAERPLDLYQPWGEQVPFHLAVDKRTRMLAGGNRGGKTTAGVVDSIVQATPDELVPAHLKPIKKYQCPFYCRVVTPDFEKTLEPVLIPKFQEWMPPQLLKRGKWDESYEKGSHVLRLTCGCRFDFMTHGQDTKLFGGAALHRCMYDEEPPRDKRVEGFARLIDAGYNGDEIFCMTPLQGMTWAYDEIWIPGMEGTSDTIACWAIDSLKSPHLDATARDEFYAMLTPEEREARRRGIFVHFAGLVWRAWRRCGVPTRSPEVLAGCDVICSIDPGIRYPGASWTARNPITNETHTFAEVFMPDQPVPNVAAEILKVTELWKPRVGEWRSLGYRIDPAARQRTQANAETVATLYQNNGVPVTFAQNDVKAGVLEVDQRMRRGLDEHLQPDGTGLGPSWTYGTHLVRLPWELQRYRRRAEGEVLDEDTIIKENDHLCDTVRYSHMEWPWDPPPPKERGPSAYASDDDVARGPVKKGPKASVMGAYA